MNKFWGVILVELDRIKDLAKENHRSFVYLSRQLGKSDGYLKDKRLHNSPLEESQLQCLADILNTTTDYLHGETDIKEKATAKSDGLSDKEMKFLNIFRSLSEDEQDLFLKMFSSNQE